jgi:hypothetical protein
MTRAHRLAGRAREVFLRESRFARDPIAVSQ